MDSDISPLILEKAPLILAEIQKAKSVLLHCHPSPDPDSVGSALAMKFALEQLGKKATVIQGDSDIPEAFMHFPGAREIVKKDFFEIDLGAFDLFISLDTASVDRISTKGEIAFPPALTVVNIDHHATNPGFGKIDLIESSYPATGQILADLFKEWKISVTPDIAANLFIGIYTDTGGLRYRGTSARTFQIAAGLVASMPDFSSLIATMYDSNTPEFLAFEALGYDSVEVSPKGHFAMSAISLEALAKKKIPIEEVSASRIVSRFLTVKAWDIVAVLVQVEPEKVKGSFRSKDPEKFDVSKIASALGGGGHKSAAGVTLLMPFEDAKKAVVSKIKELYNL